MLFLLGANRRGPSDRPLVWTRAVESITSSLVLFFICSSYKRGREKISKSNDRELRQVVSLLAPSAFSVHNSPAHSPPPSLI